MYIKAKTEKLFCKMKVFHFRESGTWPLTEWEKMSSR